MGHEHVGVLRLDREEVQLPRREVLQVPRDDDVRITADRRRQDVPVVGVRQIDAVDQLLIAGDDAIVLSGKAPRSARAACESGPDGRPARSRSIPHGLRPPLRAKQAPHREPHQQVAKRGRIENIRAEEDAETVHALLETELLVVGGQLVQGPRGACVPSRADTSTRLRHKLAGVCPPSLSAPTDRQIGGGQFAACMRACHRRSASASGSMPFVCHQSCSRPT